MPTPKNIKKVKVKEKRQKHHKVNMDYAKVMMKLIQYFLCITSICVKSEAFYRD